MVSSRDLKNLLKAYDYCIDEDHRTFFLKMIDELRIYNNLFTSPYDSWINCIKTKNTCNKLAQKLSNLYNRKNSATYPHKLTCKENKKYHENSAKLNHIIKLLFLREMSIEIE
uniref:Uncharacterized protein n=1 Tax=Glossina palpalis gambiensis TaxID=67801 RepID=A0A1B0BYB3_9MUSC